MGWKIEFERKAERELKKLGPDAIKRILTFLSERIEPCDDPRALGAALRGPELGRFWKYRVGDYRIIASIEDETVTILVLSVGHRREVYR